MNTKIFIEKLEKTGDILLACIESDLDPKDYLKAYENDVHFKALVDDTVLNNDLLLDRKIQQLSKKKILDMLMNGIKVKKASNKYIRGTDGDLIRTEHTVQESILPTPMFAIQYGLSLTDKDDTIYALIRRLVEENLLPVSKARQILDILNGANDKARQILSGEVQHAQSKALSDDLIVLAQSQLLGIPLERFTQND